MSDKDELKSSSYIVKNYVASYIDLLGERAHINAVKNIQRISQGGEYQEKFHEFIKSVEFLHNTINAFLTSHDEAVRNNPLYDILGIGRECEIKFQRFSDAIVVFTSLLHSEGRGSILKDIHSILSFSGALCLIGLYNQTPVRIGISLGWGIELNEGELYGEALMNSYLAESSLAQYPRVIVDQSVVEYLSKVADSTCEEGDLLGKTEIHFARKSLEIIGEDFDGNFIIDYLSPNFYPTMKEHSPKICSEAYKFVEDQLDQHRKRKDVKLASRYLMLRQYFQRLNKE